jgi:hypothetical protein
MAARAKAPNKQHVPVNFALSAWALRSVARFVKATATASRGAVYLNTSPLFFFFVRVEEDEATVALPLIRGRNRAFAVNPEG